MTLLHALLPTPAALQKLIMPMAGFELDSLKDAVALAYGPFKKLFI